MTPERLPDQPSGVDDHVELVRREERLAVATEVHATERIRFERVVVTEQRTITVDVSREELRITREPIPAAESLLAGPRAALADPVVMILREERVDVVKTLVPVERITLTSRRVTDDVVVNDSLGREEIDVDREPR